MSQPEIHIELAEITETDLNEENGNESLLNYSKMDDRKSSNIAALLAVEQARLGDDRLSRTDPQKTMFPSDFRRAYYPPRQLTSALVVQDPSNPKFDMRAYYVEFVDKWFPGRMLGAYLEFRDIHFSATVSNDKSVKTVVTDIGRALRILPKPTQVEFPVLDGVSGYLEPGDMCIILGGPSSGKSSLLKAIANRLSRKTTGVIRVNGKRLPPNYNRVVAYVPQVDVHIPSLTVEETLKFSAELQLPEEMTEEDKMTHISAILKLLGLEHAASTMVGNDLIRGISGGEKKRVTIGVEMLKTPNVLLLDEPTTGLDSSAAFKVMSHVRAIADVGFPCMVSLLQPSKEIYDLFNQVMLISQGQVVYFGSRAQVIPYFESIGIKCPEDLNPAEFLSQVADHPEKFVPPSVSASLSVEHFHEEYRKSSIYAELGRKMWKGVAPREAPSAANHNTITKYAVSMKKQIGLNLSRAIKINLRDPAALQVRISRGIFMGFILATLFMNMSDSLTDARNKLGIIINVVSFVAFGSAALIPLYLDERNVYYTQRDAKYFQPFAYFLAVNIADIPFTLLEVTIFSIIVYFSTGLVSTAGAFFYFLFMLFGTALWSQAYARSLTAITPNFSIANAIIPASIAMFLLFNGYLIPSGTIPSGWKWFYWLSPLHYGYEGLALNEFDMQPINCRPHELIPPPFLPNFNEPFSNGGFEGNQVCQYNTGNEYMATYGIQQGSGWYAWDMALMYIFYFIFLALSYVFLKYVQFDIFRNPQFEDKESRAVRRQLLAKKEIEKMNGKSHADDKPPSALAYLEFKNLGYSVPIKDGKQTVEKHLLSEINGYVKPGTMVALMGPSGAGKTTLLDVLADRKTGGTTTGELLVNGAPRNEFFNRISGYVEQNDIHFSRHTIREAITFAAMCRLPEEMSRQEKLDRVEQVIRDLDMEDIADDIIGSISEGGLSPEQRKRLTIAVELVTDPPLLFLDEPTSGLDAFGATLVMKKIRQIAKSGRSVICTIHQPSAELFLMFDHLLLLRKGGRQVFFGPVGPKISLLLAYIKTTFNLEFANDRNPADWMMDTVCEAKNVDGAELWDKSPESLHTKEVLSKGITPPDVKPPHFDRPRFASSFKTQFSQVWSRTFLLFWRNPLVVLVRLGIFFFVGLIIGTLCIQTENSQLGAGNKVALIFFSVVFAAFACQSSIGEIMDMRTVFYREKASGTYRTLAIAVSLILVEMPFHVVYCLVFVIPLYWIAGLAATAGQFFFFLLLFFVTYLTAVGFAQVVAVLSPNAAVANAIAPTLTSIFFIFAGFLIPRTSIPNGWIWMYYIDYFTYAVEALTVNELQGSTFFCLPSEFVRVVNPSDPTEFTDFCPITTGEQFLDIFGLSVDNKWRDFGILLGFYAFFVVLVFIGMRFYSALKR